MTTRWGRLGAAVLAMVTCVGFPAASQQATPQEAGAARTHDILYVNLLWHQHQPLYAKDAEGVYSRPWARVHATKDYYDMAAILQGYPSVRATFNLTPVLLRQLEDLAGGAKDVYWTLAERPAGSLTAEEKHFIVERFFDSNYTRVIGRFPRYAELLARRQASGSTEAAAASFSEADFRDLQVWFNLAWFDPSFLAQAPLSALVAKGRDFTEADKVTVFGEVRRIVREIVPLHRRLQERGQIEVITSPLAHPILPLLYSTALAARGDPSAPLPEWYTYANDAIAHLARSVQTYERLFGRKPLGLWPSEGSVAPEIVPMVAKAGYTWMATGEQVLAKSLGLGDFSRDTADTVREADELYRPYYVRVQDGSRLAMVFRDQRLSDLIGFEYSGTPGETAAADLVNRIEAIRQALKGSGKPGPHLVSIILDGENAWEHYENDGKAFLEGLYKRLESTRTLKTITVTDYLKLYPDQRTLDTLWSGSWFSPDYATWIGETEENAAWGYLSRVRKDLAQYDVQKRKTAPSAAALERALDFMYFAEGSDWFWWYGTDQDSGNDAYFDEAYRALLTGVYASLGETPPDFLRAPIIAATPAAARPLGGTSTPRVDGQAATGEWDNAAAYERRGGVMAGATDALSAVNLAVDSGALYLRADAREDWTAMRDPAIRFYFAWNPRLATSPFTISGSVLGFGADAYLEAARVGGSWKATVYKRGPYQNWVGTAVAAASVASAGRVLELSVPLAALGESPAGSPVRVRAALSRGESEVVLLPESAPFEVVFPLLGSAEPFLVVDDPAGDDRGPGTYTYPLDVVFKPGVFDLKRLAVAASDRDLVFTFRMGAPIENPWGSGIRLSLQTLDVYIDVDPGAGTGARALLEGRNAALQSGHGWDWAIWVEGWNQKLFSADAGGRVAEVPGSPVKVTVDGPNGLVTVSLPKSLIPAAASPSEWGYVAAVLSQDGFPAPGVRRVRDVKAQAEQWRIGGAPQGANVTRILDLAWAGTPTQEQILSGFTGVSAEALKSAGPEVFAQVPLIRK